MERPIIGAHTIASRRLYAVARVSSLVMTGMAIALGWFVIHFSGKLFDSPPWYPFVDFVGGDRTMPGWILLIGGLLGVVGLVTRSRAVSLLSCLICLGWCGWIAAFLWWANFNDEPNIGSFFAVIAGLVFGLRFWLLVVVPGPGEAVERGW